MNPVLIFVIVFVAPLVLLVFTFVNIMQKKEEAAPPPPKIVQVDPLVDFKAVAKKMPEAQRLYKQVAHNAREDRDTEEAQKKFNDEVKVARKYIQDLQKEIDDLLKPIRDKHGGELPQEYSGYASDLPRLQQWLSDLNRYTGF